MRQGVRIPECYSGSQGPYFSKNKKLVVEGRKTYRQRRQNNFLTTLASACFPAFIADTIAAGLLITKLMF
jgi:hypothetical protein